MQRDRHPGSVLFSVSGSAIKRTTAGVKASRRPSCQVRSRGLAFTLLISEYRTKKEYCFPHASVRTLPQTERLAGILADIGSLIMASPCVHAARQIKSAYPHGTDNHRYALATTRHPAMNQPHRKAVAGSMRTARRAGT